VNNTVNVESIFSKAGLALIQDAIDHDGFDKTPSDIDIIVVTAIFHRRANFSNYDVVKLKELMIAYKERNLNSFDTAVLDLFYKADDQNQARLYLAFNMLGESFFRYGRENINILKMKEEQ
jgi:hypothetical protein